MALAHFQEQDIVISMRKEEKEEVGAVVRDDSNNQVALKTNEVVVAVAVGLYSRQEGGRQESNAQDIDRQRKI